MDWCSGTATCVGWISGTLAVADVTRKTSTDFDTATGIITADCPFCDMVTAAESEACGVEETTWDVHQRCSHFRRFEEMRAVYEGPFEMLEAGDA